MIGSTITITNPGDANPNLNIASAVRNKKTTTIHKCSIVPEILRRNSKSAIKHAQIRSCTAGTGAKPNW